MLHIGPGLRKSQRRDDEGQPHMILTMLRSRTALALLVTLALTACGGSPYRPQPDGIATVTSRAESQSLGNIRVRVAVPSPEETRAIFDLPLYEGGVQPVWIEVRNEASFDVRYAPVGTDRDYVPPFEVAYTNKTGFSGAAHAEMETYLHGQTMPRVIGAGETESGFVFTQARPGTKGVNIDLFGPESDQAYSFVFFVPVPGFVADHAQVNFEALYSEQEMTTYDLAGLREALRALPCCASDRAGTVDGDPLNVVLVGHGDDVLQALLRAGWFERIADERGEADSPTEAAWLFGRTADAVFRRSREGTEARSELRLWMAPMQLGDKPVWLGDVIHFIAGTLGAALDPDIDEARDFFLQDIWYAQGLARFAWIKGPYVATIDAPREDVLGNEYFSDGHRIVIWPSGSPVSLLEADNLDWDPPPAR